MTELNKIVTEMIASNQHRLEINGMKVRIPEVTPPHIDKGMFGHSLS